MKDKDFKLQLLEDSMTVLTWRLEVESTQLNRIMSIWQQFSWR